MKIHARRAGAMILCAALALSPAVVGADSTPSEAATASPQATSSPTPPPASTDTPAPTESPEPTPTPAPTQTPSPTATSETTATPEPTRTPFPMPSFGPFSTDAVQPEVDKCAMHFEITRAKDDVRAIQVLFLLLPDGTIETPEQLAAAVAGLPEESWAEQNQLLPDEKDEKHRYAVSIPYGTRYAFALRFTSTKEILVSAIYEPIVAPDVTPTPDGSATPDPNATPEPETTPDPSEWDEFEEPPVPPSVPSADQAPYVKPKDDDLDGLYSRTEYRLGLDPQRRDSLGDGYWDGLRLYLGEAIIPDAASERATGATPAPALTSTPKETPAPELSATPDVTQTPEPTPEPTASAVLEQAPDAAMLGLSVEAGLLSSPVSDPDPKRFASDFQKKWTSGGTAFIGHIDHKNLRMTLLNNRAVFAGKIGSGEQLVIDSAISLSSMGLGGKNYHSLRAFDVTRDGRMVLLYDRAEREAALTDDARLIDLVGMKAYRVLGTKNALNIALSPDGRYIAIQTKENLIRLDLSTGERFVEADPDRMERVDMLSFTAENLLITRVTSMGCTALAPDGTWTLAAADGIFVRSRDVNGITVYDKDQQLLEINMQVYYQTTGLYIKGEDKKAVRNFSPSYFRRSLLNKEIEN